MANIKQIRSEPVQPIVRGGNTRPSRFVNLAAYPAVARRQSVNARLLQGLCGYGEASPAFGSDDTAILLRIVRERFDPEHALLRRRAVTALADTRSIDAMEKLSELALSPIEDESIRASALAAVQQAAPSFGTGMAALLRKDKSPLVRVRAQKSLATALGGKTTRRRARRQAPTKDR